MFSHFRRHNWHYPFSLSNSYFYSKVHIHPKMREKHSGPTWEGNQCHARHQDHLLSTTLVKLSYGLLITSSRSPVICSNA